MQRRISRSGLATSSVSTNIGFDTLRDFQRKAVEWYRHGDALTCAITAPTGSGKSAIFAEIAQSDDSRRILLTYPTNALLSQQKEKIEQSTTGLTVGELSSETLSEHGKDRLEEVLGFAQNPRYDVVITNPDILQALLSHQYYGDTGDAIQFFKQFSAVVYDEFHFYSTLAASGIFTQITTLNQLTSDTKILLTSATPDDDFLDHIEDYLAIDVRTISADTHELTPDENPSGIDAFREPTAMNFHPDQLSDSFPTVLEMITQKIRSEPENEPAAAIIFNSAHQSNRFQEFVEGVDERMGKYVAKDNGYDTRSENTLQDEWTVLNTTSKGEVGLDYDLDLLIMQCPYESRKFIQRAGRVGRKSPATAHVFGMGSVSWPRTMSYEEFENNVYNSFKTPLSSHNELFTLRALRTAVAVSDRESDPYYQSPDIERITDIPQYDRWSTFVDGVIDFIHNTEYGPLDAEPNSQAKTLLNTVYSCFDGIRSLRGVSTDWDITYPAGRDIEATTYDITTSLKHYGIRDLDEEEKEIDLGGEPAELHIGYEQIGVAFDGHMYAADFEEVVTQEIMDIVTTADFAGTDINIDDVVQFFEAVPIADVLPPTVIATDGYRIDLLNE